MCSISIRTLLYSGVPGDIAKLPPVASRSSIVDTAPSPTDERYEASCKTDNEMSVILEV